jgi:hypothetical protein
MQNYSLRRDDIFNNKILIHGHMTFFYRQSKFQNHYYKLLLLNFFKIHGKMTIFMPIENLKSLLQFIIDTNFNIDFFYLYDFGVPSNPCNIYTKSRTQPYLHENNMFTKKKSINQTYKRYKH